MKYFCLVLCLFVAMPAQAVELKIGDKVRYNVSVAISKDEQQKGLMFVRSLPVDEGMLFDFRRYQKHSIAMWMKNTYIPLDMLFISCDFRVVDIYRNAKPMSLDTIRSETDYCYVLEINGGQADLQGICVGDKVLYPAENKVMLKP